MRGFLCSAHFLFFAPPNRRERDQHANRQSTRTPHNSSRESGFFFVFSCFPRKTLPSHTVYEEFSSSRNTRTTTTATVPHVKKCTRRETTPVEFDSPPSTTNPNKGNKQYFHDVPPNYLHRLKLENELNHCLGAGGILYGGIRKAGARATHRIADARGHRKSIYPMLRRCSSSTRAQWEICMLGG